MTAAPSPTPISNGGIGGNGNGAPARFDRSPFWRFAQAVTRFAATLCFDLKVWGTRHVPRTGGALIVANHQSYLDPVIVCVHLKRPVSFLAKSELFTNRYFGGLIRSLHAFPVRQGEGDVGAVRETIRRLREGHVLNIYPEGSRSSDGLLQRIQPGVSLIVKRAGVPIIPVGIHGAFEAYPNFKKYPRCHPVRVLYGPPLHIHDLKGPELTRRIGDAIQGLMTELQTDPRYR